MTITPPSTNRSLRTAAGPLLDFNRSRVSRYLQLATLFRNWITSGRWPVGGRIPNVEDLAKEFTVARGTIREALGMLEQEGLLERYRAKGTFVRSSPLDHTAHKLEIDWASLISAHEGAEIEVLESKAVKALPALYAAAGKPTKRYQMMRRLHLRGGTPYLVGRFFLDHELYKKGPPARFQRHPTLPILQKIAGRRIAQARQILTIGMADLDISSLLEIAVNAPVAYVQRIATSSDGTILYIGEGFYRGDAIRLEIDLR